MIKLKKKIDINKKNSTHLLKDIKRYLTKKFNIKIEYLEARNIDDLKTNIIKKKYKLFIAYYINDIRLIDNF